MLSLKEFMEKCIEGITKYLPDGYRLEARENFRVNRTATN